MKFKIISATDQPDQLELVDDICMLSWPEFMTHDPIANKNWAALYSKFPEYQFTFRDKKNDDLVAIANTIPLSYNDSFENFPEAGWDYILQKGVDDYNNNITPNIMSALQIVVTEKYLGKGISSLVLQEMRSIAANKKHPYLIAPVRPNLKPLYPITPIEDYITWRNQDGRLFDAWLRVHESAGGKIIKVCHEAMRIPGSIADWESWAKMKFPATGVYTVKGALVPIEIDKENDKGLYIEPNVLVVHTI